MRRSRFASETWATLVIAALLWGVGVAAVVSMIGGDPSAINAVIGCGITAPVTTAAGIGLAHQDLRWRR
ncbi:hypothetical protein [Streptomyces sp. SID4982]|uniref:hypothetical protein n=1 Tax=Streptomyces sp. SID4982 TaxID=2690291 RepID=UPI00136D6AD7|nr:hypothetical protein [Streptomyces sp. SID4982]MYS15157.1 hypothetical protein [Streptomyces sp. SID4982]